MQDFPRFLHSTISFNSLKDKILSIRKYFDSQICIDLPLTDICSRYFWKTLPDTYHNFDTIVVIEDEHDNEQPVESESEDESESNLDEDDIPLTTSQFQANSHLFILNSQEFSSQTCPICRGEYEDDERISVLNCHHQYHSECIQEWLTKRHPSCPTCREGMRESVFRKIPPSLVVTTGNNMDDEIASLSNSLSSSSLNGNNDREIPFEQLDDWMNARTMSTRTMEFIVPPRIRELQEGSRLRNEN